MGHRNPVRFLAPLVLIAILAAIFIVVQASRSDSSKTDEQTAAAVQALLHRPHQRRQARRRFYVVRAGDNLTLISQRTGVSVERIQTLNPSIDASALHVGQRLRLTS